MLQILCEIINRIKWRMFYAQIFWKIINRIKFPPANKRHPEMAHILFISQNISHKILTKIQFTPKIEITKLSKILELWKLLDRLIKPMSNHLSQALRKVNRMNQSRSIWHPPIKWNLRNFRFYYLQEK